MVVKAIETDKTRSSLAWGTRAWSTQRNQRCMETTLVDTLYTRALLTSKGGHREGGQPRQESHTTITSYSTKQHSYYDTMHYLQGCIRIRMVSTYVYTYVHTFSNSDVWYYTQHAHSTRTRTAPPVTYATAATDTNTCFAPILPSLRHTMYRLLSCST